MKGKKGSKAKKISSRKERCGEGGKGVIPRLRFPEFRDSGAWKLLPIGRKVNLLSGFPFKSGEMSENPSGIRLLRGINVTEGRIRHNKKIDRYYLGSTDELKKYMVRINDLIIGMDGSKVGKNSALITVADDGALLVQRVARLRCKCDTTVKFIYQHINSNKFHSYVDKIHTSSGIPHISAKQIKDFQIYFPSIDEQQKIASCLSSLDELITAESQKLDKLKNHKKGLMQQLFPAEGETVPKLRFPEFRETGEWEKRKLNQVCQMQAGRFVPASEIYEIQSEGLYPCYGGNGLRGYTKNHTHIGRHPLIGRQGALCGNVTMANGKFQATEHAVAATPKNNVNVVWLFYWLVQSNLNQYATGLAQPGLSVDNLKKLSVRVPTSKTEQQKIASCLSSLDDLITAQTQKLDTLKAHKKGLMQQLFPSLDEVQR